MITYVTNWRTRLTRSARGELFNPLIYPFLFATLAYGVGFSVFGNTDAVGQSSLYQSMYEISPVLTTIWGVLCLLVITVGVYVLLFNKPPIGKVASTVGVLLWIFATWCYALTGGWLTIFSVSLPSVWFWIWQYVSLRKFRAEDVLDKASIVAYDEGEYDDDNGGKKLREDNRGVDEEDRTPYN